MNTWEGVAVGESYVYMQMKTELGNWLVHLPRKARKIEHGLVIVKESPDGEIQLHVPQTKELYEAAQAFLTSKG